MNRRKFLAIAGGGVVLAAGVSIGGFVASRSPGKALRPWLDAGSIYTEPRRKALSYAILAPNPHNRQPWLIDLSHPDQVVLYADRDRLLPHTDPFNRQITIGLGCFLETMRMAASQDGFRVDFQLFPEGENGETLDMRSVAIATFSKNGAIVPDPLFAQVLERRSLKEPYDVERPVSSDSLARLQSAATDPAAVGSSNEAGIVKALRQLTREALIVELETPRTYRESVDLFRIGKAEIEANPDGIDFSGPLFETMHMTGMFTREAALDTGSAVYAQGLDAVLENADTAMAHLWMVSPANTRVDQIGVGRDWVRINLAATAEGLGTQPMSQALQEFPEMKALYAQAHDMLAPSGGTVQMLARLGYGILIAQSPRWPLSTRIVKEQV